MSLANAIGATSFIEVDSQPTDLGGVVGTQMLSTGAYDNLEFIQADNNQPAYWPAVPVVVYAKVDRLREPLMLEVERGLDYPVVLFSSALQVGGTGDTFDEAVDDLLDTAFRLLAEFRDTTASSLHRSASRQLARLSVLLR